MRSVVAAILVLLVCSRTTGSSAQSVSTDVRAFRAASRGALTGPRMQYHRLTLGLLGPETDEMATPNPFTNYRLDVTFTHDSSGARYKVPGYYAADGNAANSGATSGRVWLCHFTAPLQGSWSWSASFTTGNRVAQRGGGRSAGFFDGATGSFSVQPSDKTGFRDNRRKGHLRYIKKNHLRYSNGDWFLKTGADSPENFLAYDAFDNTPNYKNLRKSWSPHLRDYRDGDATWGGGKGKEIIGALNYLGLEKGMNAFSCLTMNIEGDDRNVFPYVNDQISGRERIDVSKTAQWEVVFEHADKVGMFIHFKTQEQENDQLLDGGALGPERRLYYRELMARFGHHLALNWNIGEENTNTHEERVQFGKFFRSMDPYKHPVVVHTFPSRQNSVYAPLVGLSQYQGVSVQAHQRDVFENTLKWRTTSEENGRPWVVANDEQGGPQQGIVPDNESFDPNHDDARTAVLWGNLMAGGAGVEYYFGYRFENSDLTCQDFRSRDQMWDQSRYAREFFERWQIKYWNMKNIPLNTADRTGKRWCLGNPNKNVLVIYMADTNNLLSIDADNNYRIRWYNPRTGGKLQNGSVESIQQGRRRSLGAPPHGQSSDDWVLLLRKSS